MSSMRKERVACLHRLADLVSYLQEDINDPMLSGHYLGLLVDELASCGDGRTSHADLAGRALAGLRSLADRESLRDIRHALERYRRVLPPSGAAALAAQELVQWIGFHEGVLRQLRVLLSRWGDAPPKPPADLVGSRVAPDAAMRQLKQLSGEFRLAADQWVSDEGRQRSWRALCELLTIAAGYEASLITGLGADVLRAVRIEARPGAPVPLCVPVIGIDGSSELAHLRISVVPDQSGVSFEPPGAFDARAKEAAQGAVHEAWDVAGGRRPVRPGIRCELVHPDGICVEGASLGPAVHAASVFAFRGEWTPALEDSIVLAGVLEPGANGPALGGVGRATLLQAKLVATPPDMLLVHSRRESLAVPNEWARAARRQVGEMAELAPLLGPPVVPVAPGRVASILTDQRRMALGALAVVVLALVLFLLLRGHEDRAVDSPTNPGTPAASDGAQSPTSSGGSDGARGDVRGIPPPSTPTTAPSATYPEPPDRGGSVSTTGGQVAPRSVDMRVEESNRTTCQGNLKALARACLMYAMDYDQRLPRAGTWSEGLVAYTGNDTAVYQCPSAPGCWGYGLNSYAAGQALARLPQPGQTPLMVDCGLNKASATISTGHVQWRHLSGANLAYVDGSVKWVPCGRLSYMR